MTDTQKLLLAVAEMCERRSLSLGMAFHYLEAAHVAESAYLYLGKALEQLAKDNPTPEAACAALAKLP